MGDCRVKLSFVNRLGRPVCSRMFVKRKILIRYTPDPEQRVSQRLLLGCGRTGVFLTRAETAEAYEMGLPTQKHTVLFVYIVPMRTWSIYKLCRHGTQYRQRLDVRSYHMTLTEAAPLDLAGSDDGSCWR